MDVDSRLISAIRGPITLITLGVLFTLDHFTRYSFSQTWPVLLIVFGPLSLMRRGGPPRPAPPPPPPGRPSWANAPGPPPAYPASGGYRQSSYGAAPPGAPEPPGPPGGSQ